MPYPISHLLALVTIVLPLALNGASQMNPPKDCPEITVTGPAGIPDEGALIPFYVQLKGNVRADITYRWRVSTGKVAEGQGTDKAKFDVGWPTTPQVTATVEVRGLPEGCPHTVSETLGVSIDPGPILVSSTTDAATYTKRVNELIKELEKYSTSQGYIYIGSVSSDRYKQIEQFIRDTALQAAFDQSRLTINRETTSKEIVELWLIRPGVDNPLCKACEPVEPPVCTLPFDTYGKVSKDEERVRLDNAAMAMINNPTWFGVVILFISSEESKAAAMKRMAFMRDHLIRVRKVSSERLDIHFAYGDESLTIIHIVNPELRLAPKEAFNAKPSVDELRRKN
jgi:hypothetical protein